LLPFRGIDGLKYGPWLHANIFELASKKLYFRKLPRIRFTPTTEIGATIRTHRIQRALTQQEFAEMHGLPLRIIRDLEQGRNHASLNTVIAILSALDLKLSIT
jgi:DNA-binding XRE family transcriptional regulator